MPSAFIYFRKASNNSDFDNETLPTDVLTNFPDQVLHFNVSEDLLESVSLHYENNIKDTPISNPDGSRTIAKQDNGLMSAVLTLRGRFKDPNADIFKLIGFAIKGQVESTTDVNALSFGIFGFYTDNTTLRPFNIDPIVSGAVKKGLTIRSFDITRIGQIPKNFDFQIVLTFGGKFV